MKFDEIDWIAVWNATVPDTSVLKYRRENDPVKFWNDRAPQFNHDAMQERVEDVDEILQITQISETTTIIDVGAGTGRFSIPLAKLAHHVSAIDPSTGMLKFLEKNAAEAKIQGKIRVINRKWEDLTIGTDLPPHDIVIAPYVMAHLDIARSLPLINAAAVKWVFLFTWVVRHSEDFIQLWQTVHGEKYQMPPEYLILLSRLYQLGIHANLKISPRLWWGGYTTAEAAFTDYKRRINPPDDSYDDVIWHFVREKGVGDENGVKFPEGGLSAMIWWKKGN